MTLRASSSCFRETAIVDDMVLPVCRWCSSKHLSFHLHLQVYFYYKCMRYLKRSGRRSDADVVSYQPVAMLMCIGRNTSRNQEWPETRSVYRQRRTTSQLRNWQRAGSKTLLPDFGA